MLPVSDQYQYRLGKTITIHTNSYEFVIKYIPLEYISRAVLPKRKPKTDEFSQIHTVFAFGIAFKVIFYEKPENEKNENKDYDF